MNNIIALHRWTSNSCTNLHTIKLFPFHSHSVKDWGFPSLYPTVFLERCPLTKQLGKSSVSSRIIYWDSCTWMFCVFQNLFQGERAIPHCLMWWRRSTLLCQSHREPRASSWQNQIWLFQVTFWICQTVTVYFAQIDDELEQFFHKYAQPLSCMTNSPMWVARVLLLDCQASVGEALYSFP